MFTIPGRKRKHVEAGFLIYWVQEHSHYYGGNIMKSYKKELTFNIPERRMLVNITDEVQKAVDESGANAF